MRRFTDIGIATLISLIVGLCAYLFVPISVWDYIDSLFHAPNFGSTITTIQGSDTLSASRSVINTNFSNLNTDKLEAGSTASSLTIGTLTNGSLTSGIITAGSVTATTTSATSTFPGLSTTHIGATLGTITAATATRFSISSYFQLPNSASQSPTIAGHCAWDTTSGQFKCGNGTATAVFVSTTTKSFFYATTTTWTATTTLELGPALIGETWNTVSCYTDAGTLNFQFSDQTNSMNMYNASTTANINVLTTNNTFTVGEKRRVVVGTPASSPKSIACTVSLSVTAD